ncbi:PE domain-containing protein [Nocardia blacklockiae]|uniref:PE domain-containing protein n=1 Tax=Nocardia blacklockiae TaxID=480036 RepID=UPI001893B685|nr:PPE domain-containing protein [Nocardia blacklockiae]MBF6175658.1 PPE domain-containing protein [Nocardia blacklockiae]
MPMNVDPAQLAAAAAKLADIAHGTGGELPTSWVLPAGSDPISAGSVPQLNDKAASTFNGMAGVLNDIHRLAHEVGASASDYTKADDESARTVNNGGGEILTNPVAPAGTPGQWRPPTFKMPAAAAAGDPLVYAQQLRAGPGTGPANGFSSDVRKYLAGSHPKIISGVDDAVQALQHWTPVGSKAAGDLHKHRNRLDQYGSDLEKLVDMVETYTGAFDTAKAKHPTPEEIIAARKELLRSIRSKNEAGIQAALAKFEEQNARSTETMTGYSSTVNGKNAANGNSASGASSGQSSGGDAMSQMLPSLLSSMMSGAGGLAGNLDKSDSTSGLDDYDYDYSDYGGVGADYTSALGGGGGGGGISGAGIPSTGDVSGAITNTAGAAMGAMAASAAGFSGAGTATAAESLRSAGGAAAGAARAAAGGSPMMPYMPMAPGMGGAGGAGGNSERNRVVAWHPDRLMYVDDTPHTEQVIGEKPTIAPTVTPPTPGPAGQDTRAGGST